MQVQPLVSVPLRVSLIHSCELPDCRVVLQAELEMARAQLAQQREEIAQLKRSAVHNQGTAREALFDPSAPLVSQVTVLSAPAPILTDFLLLSSCLLSFCG